MWTYNNMYEDTLYHHGIKGQKWGIRRYQNEDGSLTAAGQKRYSIKEAYKKHSENEREYRNKLSNILAKEDINAHDRKLLKYRNANAVTRIAKTAASSFAPYVIGNVVAGVKPTKKSVTRVLVKGGIDTAAKVAFNDMLAKSAAKGYTNDGNRADGKKDTRKVTKEQKIKTTVRIATGAAYVATVVGGYKLGKAFIDKKKNEIRFAKWGPNILSDNVEDYSNVVDLPSDMWRVIE